MNCKMEARFFDSTVLLMYYPSAQRRWITRGTIFVSDFLECRKTIRGKDFLGTTFTTTATGQHCLRWDTQTLDNDQRLKDSYWVSVSSQSPCIAMHEELKPVLKSKIVQNKQKSLSWVRRWYSISKSECISLFDKFKGQPVAASSNFCRNPIREPSLFCIVNNATSPRQPCDVPLCDDPRRKAEQY
jgi:hypothetical protein